MDLLHEIEIGVWKSILIHLLRILECVGDHLTVEFDKRCVYFLPLNSACLRPMPYRFRQVPTFGRDTIRRFSRNASELAQISATHYEDLLQVSIFSFFSVFSFMQLSSAVMLCSKIYYLLLITQSF